MKNFFKTNWICEKYFSLLILIISLFFYFIFFIYDGVAIQPDSFSYINMNIYREPFYPVFLAFFRWLFKNCELNFYLTAIVFIQSIVAAMSSWSMTIYLTEKFNLNRLFSVGVLCVLLSVSFLWRYVIANSVYSNSILTEGITISIYILFFRYLNEYINSRNVKNLYFSFFLAFILILTRKQMIITLILLSICMFFVLIKKKRIFQSIMIILSCSMLILVGNLVFDMGYNYMVRKETTRHTGDTRFITTMIFYTADRDDSQNIEDDEIKKIFLEIYDNCEEKGLLRNSAEKGWLNRVNHFCGNYDRIQLYTMLPIINEYIEESNDNGVINSNKKADYIMHTINRDILPHNFNKIIKIIMDNFLLGLVMTVAGLRYLILRLFSLFVYICYLLLLIYHFKRKENRKIFLFAALTFISVLINVGLVSMVIFCQTRYMIYNTALFYVSLILMAKPILLNIYKKYLFMKKSINRNHVE